MHIFDVTINCCLQMHIPADNRKEANSIALRIVEEHFLQLQERINNGSYDEDEEEEAANPLDDRVLSKIVSQIEDIKK